MHFNQNPENGFQKNSAKTRPKIEKPIANYRLYKELIIICNYSHSIVAGGLEVMS